MLPPFRAVSECIWDGKSLTIDAKVMDLATGEILFEEKVPINVNDKTPTVARNYYWKCATRGKKKIEMLCGCAGIEQGLLTEK